MVVDPMELEGFPSGMTISPNRAPAWSDEMDAIFFGIHEVEMKEGAGEDEKAEGAEEGVEEEVKEEGPSRPGSDDIKDDEKPGLVIWHWKDPRLQRAQELQASRDRDFSFLSVYWLAFPDLCPSRRRGRRQVTPADKGYWAVGRDNTEYELMGSLNGQNYQDVYAIDMRTGEKNLILEKSRWSNDISPDGSNFLYYQDGHYFTYEFASGEHRNITGEIPTSFIDSDNDVNVVDPPVRPRGWTEDGKSVLLSDGWDIYRVDVDGGDFTNLTVNGKTDQIRYQAVTQFDPDNDRASTSRSRSTSEPTGNGRRRPVIAS